MMTIHDIIRRQLKKDCKKPKNKRNRNLVCTKKLIDVNTSISFFLNRSKVMFAKERKLEQNVRFKFQQNDHALNIQK